ncbi:MAG TPA: nucleotidyl transferase AbiEii/AbiGii toxin family protein [Patescibacteria group bacterium]|nr:nucleotidyl transferase AbiEii/AbiGii toxin family protein [Patescibacteria group bacterium]
MFTKTLLPDTLRAIKLIANIPTIKNAYLAGGTALALQLGHRVSVDLDFFTQEKIDENAIASDLSKLSEFNETQRAWRTLIGKVGETKFSIFYYKYKLIDTILPFEGIILASKKDIAAMKIHAISDRGTKRDFIDAYLLAKEFTLDKMLDYYDQKYGSLEEKLYIILKSLDYFVDADLDIMPTMLINISWEDVKKYFHQEVQRLAKQKLQI